MKKNVRSHSKSDLSDTIMTQLELICINYANSYNYFTERYDGIRNIINTSSISKVRSEIRNKLVKDPQFKKDVKLQGRYWKMALDDAGANIRSMWSNLWNKIFYKLDKNGHIFNKDEKLLLIEISKTPKLAEYVLNTKNPTTPDNFKEVITDERFRSICNLLKRYIRKYKPKRLINTTKRSFALDSDMYRFSIKDGVTYINIMSLTKGKRISIPLQSNTVFTGNVRVVVDFDKKCVVINNCIDSKKSKQTPNENAVIGLDKGILKLISTSTGNVYGKGINTILKEKTEWETDKVAKRNKLWNLYYKYKAEGKFEKAENILKNNLSKKSFDKKERKYQAQLESEINYALNTFFKKEKPSEIILEDLTFTTWFNNARKSVKYYLSSWYKGYLDERLNYKAEYYNCNVTYVNCAYTSQVCSNCGNLDKESRKGEKYKCSKCGCEIDADINAAKNIKERKHDERITIYTKYKTVKEILLGNNLES